MTTVPGTTLKMRMDSLNAGEIARVDSLLALPDTDVLIELWLPESLSANDLTTLIHHLNNHRTENLGRIAIRRFGQAPDLSGDPACRQIAVPDRYLFPAGKTVEDLLLACSGNMTVAEWFRNNGRVYHSARDRRMPVIRAKYKQLCIWAERYVNPSRTLSWWLHGLALILCGALAKWFPEHGALPLPIWLVAIPGAALLIVAFGRLVLSLLVRIRKAFQHLKGANA